MIVLSPVFGKQRLPVILPGWPPEIITGIKIFLVRIIEKFHLETPYFL